MPGDDDEMYCCNFMSMGLLLVTCKYVHRILTLIVGSLRCHALQSSCVKSFVGSLEHSRSSFNARVVTAAFRPTSFIHRCLGSLLMKRGCEACEAPIISCGMMLVELYKFIEEWSKSFVAL